MENKEIKVTEKIYPYKRSSTYRTTHKEMKIDGVRVLSVLNRSLNVLTIYEVIIELVHFNH